MDIPIAPGHAQIEECRDGPAISAADIEQRYRDVQWLDPRNRPIEAPENLKDYGLQACIHVAAGEEEEAEAYYFELLRERGWSRRGGLMLAYFFGRGSDCLTVVFLRIEDFDHVFAWSFEHLDVSGAKVGKRVALYEGPLSANDAALLFFFQQVGDPAACGNWPVE